MPVSCCAFGCSNRGERDKVQFFSQVSTYLIKYISISIVDHIYPQCSERKNQWLVAICRENYIPSKYHNICSAHFINKDYLVRSNINFPRLNDETVPRVFNFPKHLIQPVKKRRAIQKINQNIPNTIITDGPSSNIKTSDINDLMQTIKSATDVETTNVIEKNFSKTFLNDMINNENVKPKGRKYHDNVKKFATTLYFYSPKAYNYVRSVLSLPDPSSIRNWITNVNAETGILLDVLTEIDCGSPATEVLVFLLTGLKSNWKWPIGYWFVDKIKSPVQTELIKLALLKCQEHNINSYDDIKCYFNVGQKIIYYTPDAFHNIKLARNALGSKQTEFFTYLSEKNSMKVKLATQTLSSSVADTLQFLQSTSEEFKNCKGTIKFIRIIDEIFGFLNSRSPFAKGYKKPISPSNLEYLESRMRNNIAYLYSLKHTSEQPLWQSRRRTFIIRFATTIKSIFSVCKILFDHDFKYVLTYKFSQDAIELLFGHIRGRFECNNNPNCLQFKYAIRSFLLHNSIKMSTGNCTLFMSNNDSLFALKWNYKTKEKTDEIIQNVQLLVDNCNDSFLNAITENILYCICGYIVKHISEDINCEYCIEAISESSCTQDHTYNKLLIDTVTQ
ncbi:hypothetical protein AGLY_000679 [Aphis glycines]|uniref:THAP-type domain-containing protein n=1 Tax=Aphis glycines TaxID=307491 RepID=A0A6G0UA77_APHGL|nr:hypothetical protein AGLY_000679 [Aphis glycines]